MNWGEWTERILGMAMRNLEHVLLVSKERGTGTSWIQGQEAKFLLHVHGGTHLILPATHL